MRKNVLLAGILAAILANALVFGALSTGLGKPTPRPTHAVIAVKTFTPNPELVKRLTTPTNTPTATPTRYPTPRYPTETLAPHNVRKADLLKP